MWLEMRVSSAKKTRRYWRAQRHFEAEQLLDREHVAVLHAHRRAIIEPVEIGQSLEVGLVLAELLGAAVEQADMRIDPLDDLAVELEHQAQHAVRGRMLRPEIDRVVGDLAVRGAGAGHRGFGLDLVRGCRIASCRALRLARRAACGRLGGDLVGRLAGAGLGLALGGLGRRRRRSALGAALSISSAFSGVGAPGASGWAFSSPGMIYSAPSQGLMKSKSRKSWASADRLVDDALLLLGIAQLDIAGEREILALRMAAEAVIGEDAAQVRIAGEERRRTCRTPRARASRRPDRRRSRSAPAAPRRSRRGCAGDGSS